MTNNYKSNEISLNKNYQKNKNDVYEIKNKNQKSEIELYSIKDAIKEFDELKNLALSCLDKNGNPNISIAMRAVENKAKIAGLYSDNNKQQINNIVKMGEIKIDGEQLKLNIGEEFI